MLPQPPLRNAGGPPGRWCWAPSWIAARPDAAALLLEGCEGALLPAERGGAREEVAAAYTPDATWNRSAGIVEFSARQAGGNAQRRKTGARHIILMETPCFLNIAALTRSLPARRPHSIIERILVACRTQPSAARKSSFASGALTCPLPLRLAGPAHIRNNMAVSTPSSCASSLSSRSTPPPLLPRRLPARRRCSNPARTVATAAPQQRDAGSLDVSGVVVNPSFRSTPWAAEAAAAAAGGDRPPAKIAFVSESGVCRCVLAATAFQAALEARGLGGGMVVVECRATRDYCVGEGPDPSAALVAAELDWQLPAAYRVQQFKEAEVSWGEYAYGGGWGVVDVGWFGQLSGLARCVSCPPVLLPHPLTPACHVRP